MQLRLRSPPVRCPWPRAPSAYGQQIGAEIQSPVQPPRLVNGREMEQLGHEHYPAVMRDSTPRGYGVSLQLRVLADSTVDPASIRVEWARNPAFAQAAMEIAPRMRFSPATAGGRAIPVWIRTGINFSPEPPSSGGEGTYDMSTDEPARLRNAGQVAREVAALYPPALRQAGVSGDVLIRMRVDPNGRVEADRVSVDLTTDPAFEEAAIAVTRVMRFTPAKIDNFPVNGWVVIPIHFDASMPAPR